MPKITKLIVDAAIPRMKTWFVWDAEVKGFGLQVLPTGVKSYVFQYRTQEGRSRRITLGRHGVLPAKQARVRARKMQYEVCTLSADPLGKKQALRKSLTVTNLLDLYLASAKFADKAPSTKGTDRGRIKNHLDRALGNKFVRNLTQEDIRLALSTIRDGKTSTGNKVPGGAGTARSSIRLLKAILNWAVSEGHAATNVANGVSVGQDGTRGTIIENAKDYETLFRVLDTMEREKRLRSPVADAIRLIALTGARRGEIAGLRWENVDLRRGAITLTRHKTARSSGKPRTIGLPAVAQAIIARQPEGKPGDYVFPPTHGVGPLILSPFMRTACDEAGLTNLTLHGLRHSLASWMAMQGAQAPEIMQVMGHTQLSTVTRYIHWARDGHAALAEKAAAGITGAFQSLPTAEVIPLRKE